MRLSVYIWGVISISSFGELSTNGLGANNASNLVLPVGITDWHDFGVSFFHSDISALMPSSLQLKSGVPLPAAITRTANNASVSRQFTIMCSFNDISRASSATV